jgi:hypothetical protein
LRSASNRSTNFGEEPSIAFSSVNSALSWPSASTNEPPLNSAFSTTPFFEEQLRTGKEWFMAQGLHVGELMPIGQRSHFAKRGCYSCLVSGAAKGLGDRDGGG